MLHTRVDLHQVRFIVNEIENFFPCEIVAAIEAGEDLTHELQVFGSVHRPAIIAEVGSVMEQGDIISARRSSSLQ